MTSSPAPSRRDLRDARILLTGASGFIGRHVARRLAHRGAVVHGSHRRELTHPLDAVDAWHRVDLGEADAVRALVDQIRPDAVLHLASHVAGSRDLDLVLPTFRANLASTVHLLDALERLDGSRRFVQIGSLEEPDDDRAAPVPSSPYAAAKAAASAYTRMFQALYGTEIVLARVFMVYGPGPQDENKLVPYVIRTLLDGDTPRTSSGTRPVDWIVVDDVAEGLVRLVDTEGVEGRRIDLGTGVLHTVRDVVERLFDRIAPERRPSFGAIADRQAEQVRKADADATEAMLGWHPSTSLDDGLARTVDWFRTHRP
ncbi:MAG: NAD(P)-dependent oxidoreductase [Acidobacteriota bacterium]